MTFWLISHTTLSRAGNMKINLTEGISFEISGELGKYHTLPIDRLIEISKNFQDLINKIARHNVKTDETIVLDLFKLELSKFNPGSAIPTFIFTPRIQTTISDYQNQRMQVEKGLDEIFNVCNSGDYSGIIKLYPDTSSRNDIVEGVYNFRRSFGKSPVQVVNLDQDQKSTPVYRLEIFKPSVRNDLITEILEPSTIEYVIEPIVKYKESIDSMGHVSNKKKIMRIDEHADIAYVVEQIQVEGRKYELHAPLLNLIKKEEDYLVIENPQLGIIATGRDQTEAETNFAEEFDYVYRNYNSYSDEQLTKRLQRIKLFINNMVNKIE